MRPARSEEIEEYIKELLRRYINGDESINLLIDAEPPSVIKRITLQPAIETKTPESVIIFITLHQDGYLTQEEFAGIIQEQLIDRSELEYIMLLKPKILLKDVLLLKLFDMQFVLLTDFQKDPQIIIEGERYSVTGGKYRTYRIWSKVISKMRLFIVEDKADICSLILEGVEGVIVP